MPMRFSPQSQVNEYTILGPPISIGANAVSYKAETANHELVFLKQYKSPTITINWYKKYVKYQKEIKKRIETSEFVSQQTCQALKFFEHKPSSSYCQTFRFVEGCNLKEWLVRANQSWPQRLIFARLLIWSVIKVHQAGIIHADLKPENFYLLPDSAIWTGYRFYIIDFDRSLLKGETAPWDGIEGYAGTPQYFSPEHIRNQVPNEASDIFTAGIILHELLCKEGHPFQDGDYEKRISSYNVKTPELLNTLGSADVDMQLQDLLKAALCPVAKDRPTAEQIHEALKGKPVDSFNIPEMPPRMENPKNLCHAKITLIGERGEVSLNITTDIGRRIYKSLVPPEECDFVDENQFQLLKEAGSWYICTREQTKQQTLLNGENCEGGKKPLNDQDVITIASRRDKSKQVAKLKLSLT